MRAPRVGSRKIDLAVVPHDDDLVIIPDTQRSREVVAVGVARAVAAGAAALVKYLLGLVGEPLART
jgi:hypothetical protein